MVGEKKTSSTIGKRIQKLVLGRLFSAVGLIFTEKMDIVDFGGEGSTRTIWENAIFFIFIVFL